ncbi:MAG: DNA primase [Firmicutes bacterium]|nr:DNA primase [Bacillota bacterium]
MSWIKDEDLKQIRAQADIVDIISNYLTITKKGKNYMAICPFHDDHDPSLSISTTKQFYKCFVCGNGGDVFRFVQNIEKITFPESVVKVANLIHYPLQLSQDVFTPKENPNQIYFDALKTFIQYTEYELNSESGEKALYYLQKRHINEDILKRFQIGYAPASEKSLHFLRAKQIRDDILSDVGLLEGNRNPFHDRFLIPIHDEHGNPVGFTARRLVEDNTPKYINTGQTKIYEKGNLVFNYHRAKDFARKNGRCILCEGAMDVLAFEKADIHEALACLGTACTSQQLELIKKLRVPVLISYDGDRAGKEATYKFGKMAVEANISIQIIKNKTEKDPDEIFESEGKEGLIAYLRKTMSFVEFLMDFLLTKYNLDNYEDKLKYSQEIAGVIEKTCDSFEKTTYFSQLKTRTGFDFSQMVMPKNEVKKEKRRRPMMVSIPEDGRTQAELACLNMILLSKEASEKFKTEIGFFQNRMCHRVSLYCYDMYRQSPRIDRDVLIANINEEEVRNFLMDFLYQPNCKSEYSEEYFLDAILKIKECTLQAQIDLINREIEGITNPLEKVKKASEKQALIIQKNELRKEETHV